MAISNSTDRFNGVVASLAIKVRCVVGVESNVASLTGISNPYDGIFIVDGDRVLLTAQTDPIENGVWNANAVTGWTRAADWDGNRDVEKGSTVWAGLASMLDKLWQVQTAGVILPGSTAQSITELFDPNSVTASDLEAVTVAGKTTSQGIDLTLGAVLTLADAGTTQLLTIEQTSNPARLTSTGAGIQFLGASVEYFFDTFVRVVDGVTVQGNGYVAAANSLATANVRIIHDDTYGRLETTGVGNLLLDPVDGVVEVDGVMYFPANGSAATPNIQINQANIGIFSSQANYLQFATLGTEVMRVQQNDLIEVFLSPFRIRPAIGSDSMSFSVDEVGNLAAISVSGMTELKIEGVGCDRFYLFQPNLAMLEKAAPAADELGVGQLWINSTGNVLTYRDENGVDFVLSGGNIVDPGTADGQIPIWDQTTDTQWEPSSQLIITEAAASGGSVLFSGAAGANPFLRWVATDGGVVIIEENFLRLEEKAVGNDGSADLAFFSSGGARGQITVEHTNYFHFTQEAGGITHALFDYPVAVLSDRLPAGTVDGAQFFASLASSPMVRQQQDFSYPVADVTGACYRFNNPTAAADPGATFMRANNVVFASVTELYFDDLSVDNSQDMGWWFNTLAVGDMLRLHAVGEPDRWLQCTVDSITDNTGWWTLEITVIDSLGTVFLNAQDVQIQVQKAGGASGLTLPTGTVTNATLKWNGSAWIEEVNILAIAAGANTMEIRGSGAFLHLHTTGAGVDEKETRIKMDNFAGFAIQSVTDGGSNGPFLLGANRTGSAWQHLQISVDMDIFGSLFLDDAAGVKPDILTQGQLYVDSADDSLHYRTGAGVDTNLLAAGATTFAALTDTDVAGVVDHDMLFFDTASGDWKDTGGLILADVDGALIGMNINDGASGKDGILVIGNGNSVLESVSISALASSGIAAIQTPLIGGTDLWLVARNGAANVVVKVDEFRIAGAVPGTDYVAFSDDDVDFNTVGNSKIDWNISGFTGSMNITGMDVDLNANLLIEPVLADYSIQLDAQGLVADANVALVYSDGPVHSLDLENWTTNRTITLSAFPAGYGQQTVRVVQDGTSARTITWAGGAFNWRDNVAHVQNATLNGISIYTFESYDGGTTIEAAGADYGP